MGIVRQVAALCPAAYSPLVNDATVLAILLPVIAIELGLMIWALWDLSRPQRVVRGLPKAVWAVIVIFIGIIGPVVYMLFGRQET